MKEVNRDAVNLYVLTSHFPRNLLNPLLATGQAVASQHNTVYDVTISTLKPVRFIICSRTDNPVLALFSDKLERIVAAYTTIQSEPQLFADISIYWKQVLRKIDQEIKNMYTREDFLRDYPERQTEPGLFEWLAALAQKKHQQGIEQGIEKGIAKGIEKGIEKGKRKKALKTAVNMKKKGLDIDFIAEVTELDKKYLERFFRFL